MGWKGGGCGFEGDAVPGRAVSIEASESNEEISAWVLVRKWMAVPGLNNRAL